MTLMMGSQLKALRESQGVSQTLLSECASWRQSYVSTLERSPRVSLRQASRYTAALETAAARAAEIRETQAQAEAELLSRFAPVAVPARSRSASDTVPSQSRSECFIKREPAVLDPYDAAVKKITAKYGPPTKTKSGELFWSLPDRRADGHTFRLEDHLRGSHTRSREFRHPRGTGATVTTNVQRFAFSLRSHVRLREGSVVQERSSTCSERGMRYTTFCNEFGLAKAENLNARVETSEGRLLPSRPYPSVGRRVWERVVIGGKRRDEHDSTSASGRHHDFQSEQFLYFLG